MSARLQGRNGEGEERKANSEQRHSSYNRAHASTAHRRRRRRRTGHLGGLSHHVAHLAALRPDVRRPGPGSRLLALTYDDGPNDPYTWRMMEVLERHGVKATFFLIGQFVQQKPEIARALVAAGHAIGSHTWSHPNLIFASGDRGAPPACSRPGRPSSTPPAWRPKIFRPPFGGRRPATLRIGASLRAADRDVERHLLRLESESAEEIVAHAERQIRGGDVILLHDGSHVRMGVDRSRSVEASDRILSRYRGEGFEFVTIPEMMDRQLATSN